MLKSRLKKLLIFVCFFIYAACAFSDVGIAQVFSFDDLSEDDKKLWKRMLFYEERFFRRSVSLVKDHLFFLHPQGMYQPDKELEATIAAFYADTLVQRGEQKAHPQCAWPARFFWLDQKFQLTKSHGLKKQSCQQLDDFLKKASYEKVSLVFSNYFLNNPASMFGHTFLRMHKKKPGSVSSSDLLDDIVNYAAMVENTASLLYPIKGLTGGFSGKFSLMPYYLKIQEYNHFESRDLIEYELKLSKQEIDFLVLLLWEIGPTQIDYYYLDDNCSFILMMLLDALRADFNFAKSFGIYTIPADTVRRVYDVKLVETVRYRPSNLSRFYAHYEQLTDEEKNDFDKLLDSPEEIDFSSKVLDAATEYIDYQSASHESNEFKELRHRILLARALQKQQSFHPKSHVYSSYPHTGHPASLVRLSLSHDMRTAPGLCLTWRPALHSLSEASFGYSDEMELSFHELSISFDQRGVFFNNLKFIEILSLPKNRPMINPLSWTFAAGIEAKNDLRGYARAGVGKHLSLVAGDLVSVFFLAGGSLVKQKGRSARLLPYGRLGLLIQARDSFKSYLNFFYDNLWSMSLENAFVISSRQELSLSFEQSTKPQVLLLFKYFY